MSDEFIVQKQPPPRYQDKIWRFSKDGEPSGELSGYNIGVTHDANAILWSSGRWKLNINSWNPKDPWEGGKTAGILIDYDTYYDFVDWLPEDRGNTGLGDLRFSTLNDLTEKKTCP